ncbi:MAG TPA: FecR domain-containing protein [Saprospiraceae bacterium]|nr:FecR domain-containing protein [Saprospiraceae bacterium]
MDNRIKKVISQIKSEEASEQEAARAAQQLAKLWALSDQYKQDQQPRFDTEKNLAQLKQKMQQAKAATRPRRLVWLRIAATLLFLLLGAWVARTYLFSENQLQTFYNQSESPQTLSLSDGSSVEIYPGAQLIYPSRFPQKAERDVQLSGTAYFKVQADVDHPFRIQTENTQVKVVGTSFLLKAESGASETSIEVQEGRVYFLDKVTKEEILVPARQIGICQQGGILFQEPIHVEGPLEIDMRNQPLVRLFAQMERHHPWEFEVQESIKQCRLTGTFNISNPEKVLRQINGFSTFDVSKIEEGAYRISGTCQ